MLPLTNFHRVIATIGRCGHFWVRLVAADRLGLSLKTSRHHAIARMALLGTSVSDVTAQRSGPGMTSPDLTRLAMPVRVSLSPSRDFAGLKMVDAAS